jgi:hypothetical protein
MKIRIYKIGTEIENNGQLWGSVNIAAKNADLAVEKARKHFSKVLGEQLLNVSLLASEG